MLRPRSSRCAQLLTGRARECFRGSGGRGGRGRRGNGISDSEDDDDDSAAVPISRAAREAQEAALAHDIANLEAGPPHCPRSHPAFRPARSAMKVA